MQNNEGKALEGIRVLDMTQLLAGPYCGMMLADMGAEVIKIEFPNEGDMTRSAYPQVNGVSMYYNNVNRNKKGVTLNLKSSEGKELFARLLKDADVLIENNRPGVMARLGFDYVEVKKINEGIIYASISGFGQNGPYADKPGYDLIAQAMSGAMSITGWPGGPPTKSGVAFADVLGGLNAALGIVSAIQYKSRTGKGQHIDVSLVDSIVSCLAPLTTRYIYDGEVLDKIGNRYVVSYPFDSFLAKDGDYVIACGPDQHFIKLMQVMGMQELANNPDYGDRHKRTANRDALKQIIDSWGSDKTVAECVDILSKVGIPTAPILNLKQVYEDEHIHDAREMFVKVTDKVAGEITLTGNPIKMSETPTLVRHSAPSLGEHNEEIYGALGVDSQTLNEYRAKKII